MRRAVSTAIELAGFGLICLLTLAVFALSVFAEFNPLTFFRKR